MASCSPVKVQMARGVIGIGALVLAYFLYASYPPLSYLFIGVSLFVLGGCPMCWVFDMCDAVEKNRRPGPPQPPEKS